MAEEKQMSEETTESDILKNYDQAQVDLSEMNHFLVNDLYMGKGSKKDGTGPKIGCRALAQFINVPIICLYFTPMNCENIVHDDCDKYWKMRKCHPNFYAENLSSEE